MADTPSLPSRDIARIRQVLARELETISEYEELARAAESSDARAFFLHLATEEKEHVAEAVFLLGKFDPSQQAQFAKDFSTAHFGTAAAAPEPSPTAPQTIITAASPKPSSEPIPQAKYLPETHPLPRDPHHVVHALPAPPSARAGHFSVGPLKGTRP